MGLADGRRPGAFLWECPARENRSQRGVAVLRPPVTTFSSCADSRRICDRVRPPVSSIQLLCVPWRIHPRPTTRQDLGGDCHLKSHEDRGRLSRSPAASCLRRVYGGSQQLSARG